MSINGIIMSPGMNHTRLKIKILIFLDFENRFLPTFFTTVHAELSNIFSLLQRCFSFLLFFFASLFCFLTTDGSINTLQIISGY